jgi:hypothetical protein
VAACAWFRSGVGAAAIAAAAALAAPVPPWIQRAVPSPIVAWQVADVLGNHLPEGIAVSAAGSRYFIGVVDSRPDRPQMVLDYDLIRRLRGSTVRSLLAGRLQRGHSREIAVSVLVTPSIGELAWILRVEPNRLRLLRRFSADRIRISGRIVEQRWTTAQRSPTGTITRRLWRWERGAYRVVSQS